MKKNKIRLAISGIYGRMGQEILKIINQENNNISLNGILEKKNLINNKSKVLYKSNYLQVQSDLLSIINDFDILIDFTNPDTTINYLNICKKYNKKMVIGTTGFTEKEKIIIKEASKKIAIVFTSNFSQGINILFKILKNITEIFCINQQENLDIDIIEKHHKKKIDSPSGTALFIKDIIDQSCKKYNFLQKIFFHSIRAGDIPGEHKIIFSLMGEQIELTHKALNRIPFARGAVKAAIWLIKKETGIYNMEHVLNI
ncbi:4-hydroxy-tetrahydrodipicolinate reductase [Enterobacteriaceae endosymbiont of Donacia tomentosa]|uniref:4-hydroxy-tetrahydrodipicolinate reductase n=1 Tax=Enterobacteriaceae endosymbiont of Donacia tomentosa TaxID=2675787 RepID=UPI001FEA8ACA|nr:4-hydroxy-tetrahydrodipicolinate reductase [Enterobacteriaceae endosymbiont of Donacia tomentosa]